MAKTARSFFIEDHLCRSCGGRILRHAAPGATPGGNPAYRCADCGKGASGMDTSSLCWCGFSHRQQRATAYVCVPFSILSEQTEKAQVLTSAFRACGCEPGRGEVGIMLERDYINAMGVRLG